MVGEWISARVGSLGWIRSNSVSWQSLVLDAGVGIAKEHSSGENVHACVAGVGGVATDVVISTRASGGIGSIDAGSAGISALHPRRSVAVAIKRSLSVAVPPGYEAARCGNATL
jgi:hypothetical protein